MNILVTGATGAIGKEIVRQLASQGHRLILCCRSRKKGEMFAASLKEEFGTLPELLVVDLSDSTTVSRAVNSMTGVKIDAIINNAGVMNAKYILDRDGHEDTLNVNYHNTRLLTDLLIPHLSRRGAIVFTTSPTRNWFPFQKIREDIPRENFGQLSTYALSKKLITRYAARLCIQLESRGIRVNCADPGVVDTPMLRMGRWYDRLADIVFRPFCLKPATAAKAACRALLSDKSGCIFHAPFGCRANRFVRKLRKKETI